MPAAPPNAPPVHEPSPHPSRGVLGATFTDVAETIAELHPVFLLLLGIAVALLGVASTPAAVVPNAAVAGALARRRIEVTLAGVLALGVVVIAYLAVVT